MKKAIIITAAVIVLIAVGAASTIAWLTATSSTLTNTFTVGKVDITLREPVWDSYEDNLLVPGKALTKDPIVTVLAGSEKCYVFVKIETAPDLDAVIDYDIAAGWTALGTPNTDVYYQVAEKSANNTGLPVLANNQVAVPTTVDAAGLAEVQTAVDTMKITAYAIQFDYLTDATPAGAWALVSQ